MTVWSKEGIADINSPLLKAGMADLREDLTPIKEWKKSSETIQREHAMKLEIRQILRRVVKYPDMVNIRTYPNVWLSYHYS